MASFVEAMTGFMRDNFCSALDTLGDAITLGNRISTGGVGAINLPNALGALVCDRPPDNLQPPPGLSTGGQCPVSYTLNATYNAAAGGCTPDPRTISGLGVGIGPISFRTASEPPFGGPNGELCPGFSFNRVYIRNAAGETLLLGNSVGYSAFSPSLTRDDGQPDNCGNPPPVLPPPGDTVNVEGDVTYNIDGDTTVTVPVTAVYAPIFVDLDGSLKVPVTINLPDISFKGELEVAPKFELNIKPTNIIGGPGRPDDPELGPGQPGVPVPEDEPDVDVIVGVLVFSTLVGDANNATGFPSVGGPTFLVPRLGSVQFAIKTGNSIGWTSDIDVKNLECYVPCPAPQGAIAVRVTPIAGVTRTFTPVRGKPLTSF